MEDFKKEALTRPGVKADYERLAPAYDLRRKLIAIRLAAGSAFVIPVKLCV